MNGSGETAKAKTFCYQVPMQEPVQAWTSTRAASKAPGPVARPVGSSTAQSTRRFEADLHGTAEYVAKALRQHGEGPSKALLLSDVGVMLPPSLRQHAKAQFGGLKACLSQTAASMFVFTKVAGKEYVKLGCGAAKKQGEGWTVSLHGVPLTVSKASLRQVLSENCTPDLMGAATEFRLEGSIAALSFGADEKAARKVQRLLHLTTVMAASGEEVFVEAFVGEAKAMMAKCDASDASTTAFESDSDASSFDEAEAALTTSFKGDSVSPLPSRASEVMTPPLLPCRRLPVFNMTPTTPMPAMMVPNVAALGMPSPCAYGGFVPPPPPGLAPFAWPTDMTDGLKLRGLPFDATEEDVFAYLKQGDADWTFLVESIASVEVVRRGNGKSTGVAKIATQSPVPLSLVKQGLHLRMMKGRYIEVFGTNDKL